MQHNPVILSMASILKLLHGYLLPGTLPLTGPIIFLFTACTSPTLLFTDTRAFQELAFSKLWTIFSPVMAYDTPDSISEILSSSSGVILDVGPGLGHQLFRFSRSNNISAIFGAEPSKHMHETLRAQAQQAGLGEKYKILSCGADLESLVPAMQKAGLLNDTGDFGNGIFDEIVCLRVLCGVPDLSMTLDGLYRCLKSGGRLVVCEHVVSEHTVGTGFQYLYGSMGWSFWGGGCELRRDTGKEIMKVAERDGGWKDFQLHESEPWSALPHIIGYFVKK